MKSIRLWLRIAGLLIAAAAIIGIFAPFLGEVLLYCGVGAILLLFVLIVVVGFAQRGY